MLRRETACLAVALSVLVGGCSSSSNSVPNPFNTPDRVTPPTFQSGMTSQAGGAAYYPQPTYPQQSPTTFAPAVTNPPGLAPGYPAGPVGAPAPIGPTPGTATPVYSSPAPPAGTVGSPGGSASRPSLDAQPLAAAGDQVAVPSDNAAVRFGGALRNAEPKQLLASQGSPATASGWIAGSAPVRSGSSGNPPRVRLPGEMGMEQPLRVASPGSSTGWR